MTSSSHASGGALRADPLAWLPRARAAVEDLAYGAGGSPGQRGCAAPPDARGRQRPQVLPHGARARVRLPPAVEDLPFPVTGSGPVGRPAGVAPAAWALSRARAQHVPGPGAVRPGFGNGGPLPPPPPAAP